jgi:hypothetical protein
VVLNEIMEQMRKHGAGAEHYAARLCRLIEDTSQPPTVRDYSIQHLAQWISPSDPNSPGERSAESRSKALLTISQAIRSPLSAQSTVSGTGLMALADASSRLDPAETVRIWETLDRFMEETISGANGATLPVRVSAIHTSAVRGERRFLPIVRMLAADEATQPSLRLSSIAALGFFADPEDRTLLWSLSNSNTRFQYAARAALDRYPSP